MEEVNGHSLQGANNALELIGKEPQLSLSLDYPTLIFFLFVFVLCVYVWRQGKKENNIKKNPDVLSWGDLLLLLFSGPVLLLVFVGMKEWFSLPFPLSLWVSFALSLQGYIALRLVLRQHSQFIQEVHEEQKKEIESGVSRPISVEVIRYLIVASTVVGGGIIFLLVDIFLFHCYFTQMGPCPGF